MEIVDLSSDSDSEEEEITDAVPSSSRTRSSCQKKVNDKAEAHNSDSDIQILSSSEEKDSDDHENDSNNDDDNEDSDDDVSVESDHDGNNSVDSSSSSNVDPDEIDQTDEEPASADNRFDCEGDFIIPLDCDDDVSEQILDLNDKGQMFCSVCDSTFRNKTRYIIHRRRHFAMNHFKCPTCSKGFIKLSHCQVHELKEHYNDLEYGSDNSSKRYSFRSNAAKTPSAAEIKVAEKQLSEYVIPSTCLFPYRGPKVTEVYEPYEIDAKYCNEERKMNTRNASKQLLDNRKEITENTLRIIMEANRRHEINAKNEKVAASRPATSKSLPGSKTKMVELASPSRVIPSRRKVLPDETKCYSCSLCNYVGKKRTLMKLHIEDAHPAIPFEEISDFFTTITPTQSASPATAKAPPEVNKISRPYTDENITSEKNSENVNKFLRRLEKTKKEKANREKSKKIKFSKRREAVRVWETDQPLVQNEFMSAIGMIRKRDVLLGPRQGARQIESSLFSYRRIRREKSPPPHARIILNKLPLESKHNRVHLCTMCEFVAPTQKEIRRHRRNEHLKKAQEIKHKAKERVVRVNHKSKSKSNALPKTLPESERLNTVPIPAPQAPDPTTEAIIYKCNRCKYTADSKKKVKNHKRVIHMSSGSGSSECSSPAKQPPKPQLYATVTIHTPFTAYQCDQCDFTSFVKAEVKQHRKDVHKSGTTSSEAESTKGNSQQLSNPEKRRNNHVFASPNAPPKKKVRFNK